VEDFIRLNLMSLVSFIIFQVAVFIVYGLVVWCVPEEIKSIVKKIALVLVGLIVIGGLFNLSKQILVNQTPRSIIDRTYQDDTQQQYQNNLKKGVKQ
jgi:hypothetical protein